MNEMGKGLRLKKLTQGVDDTKQSKNKIFPLSLQQMLLMKMDDEKNRFF